MFTRLLHPPQRSAFLFGPRGTGKSTWIRQHFANAVSYDLLTSAEHLRLSRDPSILQRELAPLPAHSWVIIDEVQKVPALLDEVHKLMEERRLKFLLCGSSARKLKRSRANLLAGRAETLHMFPLTFAEMGGIKKFDLDRTLRFGTLPMAIAEKNPAAYLRSYAETYLQEEIRQEALTRNLGSFSRFLEIAARQNGQVTNVSNISRDAQVARQTVASFFEILVDTLIGTWLPAWKLKSATKQVQHPKFFFFDSGVVRALTGRLSFPPLPEECGHLLETFIAQELRAFLHYTGKHYPLFFWRNHTGSEVDFVLETQDGFVAIEVKYAAIWRRQNNRGFRHMRDAMGGKSLRCIGVFTGPRKQQDDGVTVFPIGEFLTALWEGKLVR